MNIINMPTIEFETGSKGNFAVKYAALGWYVIPLWWIDSEGKCACGKAECNSPGKHPYHPLAPFGQRSATCDVSQVRKWWSSCPDANIGIYLAPSGLCAIDIDPRNGGLFTIDDIEAEHGPIVSDLLQYTGGGGEHRVFERPSGTLPGKLGKGVDVKLDGYIVVEPSNHASGCVYSWEASSSPLDGIAASPLPDWIRDLSAAALNKTGIEPGDRPPIEEQKIADLRSALPYIKAPSRDDWLTVMFAIHNDIGGQLGFDICDEWSSSNGGKYDPVDQMRVWRSCKRLGLEGVTLATVFKMAMDAGWPNIPEPAETPENIRAYVISLVEKAKHEAAKSGEVLPALGQWEIPVKALQDVADWFSTLSEEPHPMISIVGALAFGSVIAGRKYRSVNANWTAMQFVLSGPSGVGKNYIKSGINRLLHSSDLSDLFGASFYTHSSAIYWALHTAPTHICVTDEFGNSFAEARKSENGNKMSVFKSFKQVYSDCDDTFRADSYSMAGLSRRDREERRTPPIVRPSLTLLGLTTPGQFYSEVKAASIEDGLMNRFVVFNVDKTACLRRQVIGNGIPHEDLINATKLVRRLGEGRDSAPDAFPQIIQVDFSGAAKSIFDMFREEAESFGDALEESGMGNMPRRWRENAMRMATMLAAWDNPLRPVVTDGVAEWCCKLVRKCGEETIKQLGGRVFESSYGLSMNMVLETIRAAGAGAWVGKSELLRKHRGVKSREMAEILSHLEEAGLVIAERHETNGRHALRFMSIPE